MKNPVDDTKNERSDKVRPYTSNRNGNIGEMYSIHHFDGQPEDNNVDDKTKKPGRQHDHGKRQKLHERLHKSIQNANNNATNEEKHKSTGKLEITHQLSHNVKGQAVQNNSKENLFDHIAK